MLSDSNITCIRCDIVMHATSPSEATVSRDAFPHTLSASVRARAATCALARPHHALCLVASTNVHDDDRVRLPSTWCLSSTIRQRLLTVVFLVGTLLPHACIPSYNPLHRLTTALDFVSPRSHRRRIISKTQMSA